MYVVNFHNFINSLLSIDSDCSTKITHILHAFRLPVESVCGWGVGVVNGLKCNGKEENVTD